MTKTKIDLYFWLGAEGEVEEVTETEFNKRQEEWDGERPSDYNVED